MWQEQQKIKEIIDHRPWALKDAIRYMDSYEEHLDDEFLDSLLGVPNQNSQRMKDLNLKNIFSKEQLVYEATPYDYIRFFIHILDPRASEVVYDLGSGFGRVPLFGALISQAKFVGIEILPERVKVANEIKKKFAIENAFFIEGNAADLTYENGTIFFLFNPFNLETLARVAEKIRQVSLKRTVIVVTWGGQSNSYFSNLPWLFELTPTPNLYPKMQFFQSEGWNVI